MKTFFSWTIIFLVLVSGSLYLDRYIKTSTSYETQLAVTEKKIHMVHNATIDTDNSWGNGFFVNHYGVLKLITAMHVVSDDVWKRVNFRAYDHNGGLVITDDGECFRDKDVCVFNVLNKPLSYGALLADQIDDYTPPEIRTIYKNVYQEHETNFMSPEKLKGSYTNHLVGWRSVGYPVRPGMSGSPVFQHNKVIGIVGALDLQWDVGIIIELCQVL